MSDEKGKSAADEVAAADPLPGPWPVGPHQFFQIIEAALDSKTKPEVEAKVLPKLEPMNGIDGMCKFLQSDPHNGVPSDSVELRRSHFGPNTIPQPPAKSLLALMWELLHDPTLIILILAACVSITFGMLFECKTVGWIEGLVILIAVAVVDLVGAVNDWQKDKQFRALSAIKDDVLINVVRDGKKTQISTHDIVVGDIVELTVGDVLCADGVFVKGNDIKINEASLTGESDDLRKAAYHFDGDKIKSNPFFFGGTKMMEGSGTMIVVAVGANSFSGKSAALMQEDEDNTTILQRKLNKMSEQIGTLGLIVAAFVLLVLFVRFAILMGTGVSFNASTHPRQLLGFFITAVTVLVVAVPEGLPLAVTIALAFSVKKMLADNNLVRHLGSCNTMGDATTICSDKTGTLTTNRMTVMKCWSGDVVYNEKGEGLDKNLQDHIVKAIALNSSARLEFPASGPPDHIGNKTECGLLQYCYEMGIDAEEVRGAHSSQEPRIFTFSSARKRMSTVWKDEKGDHMIFCKGASEIVLGLCTKYLDGSGNEKPLPDSLKKHLVDEIIDSFANDSLRTLCLARRSLPGSTSLEDSDQAEKDLTMVAIVGIEDPVREEVPGALKKCGAAGILVRMVTGDNIVTARSIARKCGIADQVPEGEMVAMEGPEFRARVTNEDGTLNQSEVDKIWPNLLVLARSSPTDKYMLVSGIMASKALPVRQIVAVTGDGTNDGPALKKADVGFAMGITGTSVAKEASDIILMDDNFSSIVKAVMWGRCVYDNICKFLQFQLTVNIAAIVIAVIGAVVLMESPLKAIHLLWINLIMDSLASLALSTEGPTEVLLYRKPYGRTKPLLSPTMLRNMCCHSFYQIVATVILVFALPVSEHQYNMKCFTEKMGGPPNYQLISPPGPCRPEWLDGKPLGWDQLGVAANHPDDPCKLLTDPRLAGLTAHYTMVFNSFVLMQLFNEVNCRRINNEMNVLEGFFDTPFFTLVVGATVILQILIIEFGGLAFGVVPLNGLEWFICIVFGGFEMVWYQIMRYISPDYFIGLSNILAGHGRKGTKLSAEEEEFEAELDAVAAEDAGTSFADNVGTGAAPAATAASPKPVADVPAAPAPAPAAPAPAAPAPAPATIEPAAPAAEPPAEASTPVVPGEKEEPAPAAAEATVLPGTADVPAAPES